MNNHKDNSEQLGDFTTTSRLIPISLLAIVIGLIATGVAWALLRLIGFFTNVFYYGRLSSALVSPGANHLGWWAVLVPVAGSLVIGLMARYGSERIRGHGIPEALESILINGSKVQPRLRSSNCPMLAVPGWRESASEPNAVAVVSAENSTVPMISGISSFWIAW